MTAAQSELPNRKSKIAEPSGLDPLRTAWQLLTNVKFALFLVGVALVAGLIGTVIPQVPGPMRGNLAARSAWIELRRDTYGPFTGPMDRLSTRQPVQAARCMGPVSGTTSRSIS